MTGHFSGHSSRPLGAIAVDQQESQLSRGTCGNSCQDMLKYVKLFERLLTLPAVCQQSASILSVPGAFDILGAVAIISC